MRYNKGEKAIKISFIIYADIEFLDGPCSYSLFPQCSFDSIKNKHSYYRCKDCMNKVCEDLRKHLTEIIKHEKKCYH